MEKNKNPSIENMYTAAGLMNSPTFWEDAKVVGSNEQGYPIIKSEAENTSIQFVIIDFGKEEE